jgi:hypothetical protein
MSSPRSLSYTQAPTVKRYHSGMREKVVILPPQEVIPSRSSLVSLMGADTQVDLPSLELSSSDILEEMMVLSENDIEEELLIVQEEWLEVSPVYKTMPASMPPLPTEPPSPDTWLDEEITQNQNILSLPMLFTSAPIHTDVDIIADWAWSPISYIPSATLTEEYVCEAWVQGIVMQVWRVQDGFLATPIKE